MHRLITLALTLLAFALPGYAQVQDVGTNLSFSGPSSLSLSFPQFDGSLGTLSGVEFGIEIDGEWNEVVTNTGSSTDSVALSWDSGLAGYYPPTAGDIGNSGYAQFGLTIDIPGAGVYSRSIWRPVAYSDTLLPGVPQVFSETVDTSLVYGGTSKERAVLAAFQGTGSVLLPVTTVGYLATSGAPQSTIATNCFADATVVVRYFYEARGAADLNTCDYLFSGSDAPATVEEAKTYPSRPEAAPGPLPFTDSLSLGSPLAAHVPPTWDLNHYEITYHQVAGFTEGKCWMYRMNWGTTQVYDCMNPPNGDNCNVVVIGNPTVGQPDYSFEMECGTDHVLKFDPVTGTLRVDSNP